MRFWVFVSTFVLGLSIAAVGVADQYQNRPLDKLALAVIADRGHSYIMIPNRTLTSYPGAVSVTASGAEKVFLATVRESDVSAWLAPSPHTEIKLSVDLVRQRASLAQIERQGEGNLVDPVGYDIWRSIAEGEGLAKIDVPSGNEVAVLIASDGLKPAPDGVTITWDQGEQPLPFSPLPPIGLVIMLVGAAGVLWHAYARHRGASARRSYRGPKPPKPRRFKPIVHAPTRVGARRSRRLTFAVLAVSLALTGCAQPYESPLTSPNPSPAPDTLTPVMTREQVQRILTDLVAVVSEADAELDREGIEVRVTGPALAMRRAAYNLARRTEAADDGPVPLEAGPIKLFLPSATDAWPRSVMVVTGEERLQLMVLRQEGPRENYQLFHYSSLLPGSQFPEVAAEELGANVVKADSKFLAFDPTKLPEAVGDLINNGEASVWATLVDPANKYVSDLVSFQANLIQTLSNANLGFSHTLGDQRITLLASADGGALVSLYMVDAYTIIPKEPGDAVAITGDEALLLGTGGSATGIETRYGAMLLFHVPATGSNQPVRLLGATQQLLTATNLGTR
jgi:uncharacterized membrane protein